MLSLLGAGLLITAIGLRALPTGFVPQEDGGQIRGVVVLPEGASLERTQNATQQQRVFFVFLFPKRWNSLS